jgi:UDP-galactopyranose mutase
MRKYQDLAATVPTVLFSGRLGEYKYYDMDVIVESALELSAKVLSHNDSCVKINKVKKN